MPAMHPGLAESKCLYSHFSYAQPRQCDVKEFYAGSFLGLSIHFLFTVSTLLEKLYEQLNV